MNGYMILVISMPVLICGFKKLREEWAGWKHFLDGDSSSYLDL